jgi:hypothetical protein
MCDQSYISIRMHDMRRSAHLQGSGKDLIQPVLDNQLKAASPLVLPPEVRPGLLCLFLPRPRKHHVLSKVITFPFPFSVSAHM